MLVAGDGGGSALEEEAYQVGKIGDADPAVASSSDGTVSILANNGDGTFAGATTYGEAASPYSLCAADFDGDNTADLAVADFGANSVTIMLNRSGGLLDMTDENSTHLPATFRLSRNNPNPFNPTTTIEYSLPRRDHVTIDIYNMPGQKIHNLVDREEPAGSYTVDWNGTDGSGKTVATGMYLYRFQTGDHFEAKKMLLLK